MKFVLKVTFLFVTLLWISSCKKDELLTDSSAKLDFSEDTVLFDTIFVQTGSTNHQLLIYNNNDQKIKITTVKLAGGSNSRYRLNLNGQPGTEFHDIEVKTKDSLWMFIEVTINPNSANLPFIVDDSVLFETNGNKQYVKLVAWGQNAHFIKPKFFQQGLPPYDIIECTGGGAVWDTLLPYVIYGYAVVDEGCTLTINAGVKVYFYNNSGLWVYKGGTLKVEGTKDLPVYFRGTRLESYYQNVPGQWDRIWINEGSINNSINYAVIKNAFIGLQTETIFDQNLPRNLALSNTRIENMSGVGIYARSFKFDAVNCVVANCGAYGTAMTQGGDYTFTHCTFANYWSGSQRPTPTVYINNFYIDKNEIAQPAALDNCSFRNCIIYGSEEQEIQTEMIASPYPINYKFETSLIKVKSNYDTNDANHFSNIYKNNDPGFVDYSSNNYQLDTLAYSQNKGNPAFATGTAQFDLKAIDRQLHLPPDLGAYEREY